jgi:hypothetical protein
VYYGITTYQIYADLTPDCSLSLTKDKNYARPYEQVNFTANVFSPSYVASAVFLDSTADASAQYYGAYHYLGDGILADSGGNLTSGRDVELGSIVHDWSRALTWDIRYSTEGIKSFGVQARGDNVTPIGQYENVVIDGTGPSTVAGLTSSTHTPFAWSNNPNVTLAWSASTDNLAGVAGYSYQVAQPQPVIPDAIIDTVGLSTAVSLASSTQDYYFSILAVDNAGNISPSIAAAGPFRIDLDSPSGVGSLTSSTHTVGVANCSQSITTMWTAASDPTSAVQGYSVLWDTTAGTIPPATVNNAATFKTTSLAPSPLGRYFHVRAVDVAGNGGPTSHIGPFYINPNPGTIYCTAKVNSLGCTPSIAFTGTPKASNTSGYVISCSNVRNQKSGLLFYGVNGPQAMPFQGGTHCVALPTKRSPSVSSNGNALPANDCSGVYTIDFSAYAHGLLGGNPPLAALTVAGTTVNCQWWGRDPGFPAPNNTTLSNGLQFTVCE